MTHFLTTTISATKSKPMNSLCYSAVALCSKGSVYISIYIPQSFMGLNTHTLVEYNDILEHMPLKKLSNDLKQRFSTCVVGRHFHGGLREKAIFIFLRI